MTSEQGAASVSGATDVRVQSEAESSALHRITVEIEAKRVDKVRLILTGHADRSGTSRYNQRLSRERADAVRQRLIRLGIGANDIAVFAKGESEPLVATSDGVREPQNRRVEIILE